MSRARRAEARRAAPYQAQIPTARARVQSTPMTPILERIELRRSVLEEIGERTLDFQRGQIADARQDAASQAGNRAAISRHPGTSEARVREQWNAIWGYYRAVQLVSDRLERAMHARTIRDILVRNELILQRLARSNDPELPRLSELRGVIIRHETARAALGAGATASLERETPDTWSERPWLFEGRAWDTNYLQHQATLRDRQRAASETRITIPRPFLVTTQQIQRVADHVLCLRLE